MKLPGAIKLALGVPVWESQPAENTRVPNNLQMQSGYSVASAAFPLFF